MSTASPAVRRPHIALLVAVSAVNPLAINMFMPSMPRMTEVFATTYAMVQLTLSLYLAVMALAQVAIGPLSDRYGRRPVLIGGLAIFVVGSLVALFATSIEVLLVGRLLQGGGGCAGIVLARAIVRDLYDRDRAASMIGYVTMGMAVAPMLSPSIGGLLEELVGWRGSFAAMLAFGGAVLIWAVIGLHETNQRSGVAVPFAKLAADWGALLSIPLFWIYAATAAFTSAVFFAFLGGAPLVTATIMHVGPLEYGLYFIMVSLGYIAGNFLTGRYAARVGVPTMIDIGSLIQLAATLAVAGLFALGTLHPLALFVPMAFVGLANGIGLPSAIAGMVSVRPDLAGAASGLGGSIQTGISAIASAAAGALLVTLWPGTPWSLVLMMVGCSVLALGFGSLVRVFSKR